MEFQDLHHLLEPESGTSPLQAGPWELVSDLEKIEQQWEPLSRILNLDTLFVERAPEVSGWSCGEQAGHSVLVLQLVATIIRRLLAHPELDTEKQPADFMQQVFKEGVLPRGLARAPRHVLPHDRTRQDFLAILDTTREDWRVLSERQAELDTCPGRYPHFIFGYLTSGGWTRLCAVHTAHHLKIVADVLAANPRP